MLFSKFKVLSQFGKGNIFLLLDIFGFSDVIGKFA